jgi:hypothetical protein
MRRRLGLLAVIGAICSCGSSDLDRPLAIEIKGLSSHAEKLSLSVFPKSSGQTCMSLTLAAAGMLKAPYTTTWDRASGAARQLALPDVTPDGATIILVATDPSGAPIQFVCSEITYEQVGELPYGVLVVTLSQRVSM